MSRKLRRSALLSQLMAKRDGTIARAMAERKAAELAERIEQGDGAALAELEAMGEQAAAELAQLGKRNTGSLPKPPPVMPRYQTPAQQAEAERLADQRARRQRRAEQGADLAGVELRPKRGMAKPKARPQGLTRRTGKNPATRVRKGLPS